MKVILQCKKKKLLIFGVKHDLDMFCGIPPCCVFYSTVVNVYFFMNHVTS